MARRQRDHQVTIRQGTGERYWYINAGYVAAAVLGLAYVLFTADLTASAAAVGVTLGIVLIGLLLFAVATYLPLFKDSAYVRGQYHWPVRWWYYFLVGLGVPLLVYVIGRFTLEGQTAVTLALLVFPFSTLLMNGVYIYNRHKYVGVP